MVNDDSQADLGRAIRNLRAVYLVLIGLVVLAVGIGFGLDEQATSTFEGSVHVSAQWAQRIDTLAAMARAGRAVRAPANEVFSSGDPMQQLARLEAADLAFKRRQHVVLQDLDTNELPREETWRAALAEAGLAEEMVVREGRQVLATIARDPAGASRMMGHMDHAGATVDAALSRLIAESRQHQQAQLAMQEIEMDRIRSWEPLIVAPLLLVALGAVVYGHRVGDFLRILEAERAAADRQLRHSHDQLEGRVHERTAELAVATHAAQAASMAKSRFLAAMGHELRTPLNAIIGYAEMLEEDALAGGNAQHAEDLAKIRDSGHHLLAMVNDILDLANLESGGLELECTALEPGPLAVEVTEAMAPRAATNGNTLNAEVLPGTPSVHADLGRLRQCLLALLDNACKFTRDGHVQLLIGPAGEGWVAFRVGDTGIGMTPEVRATVFESFVQGDGSSTRRHGGTGLGLAVVQQLVRLMGGHIDVESAPGEGARFAIVLPASTVRATA